MTEELSTDAIVDLAHEFKLVILVRGGVLQYDGRCFILFDARGIGQRYDPEPFSFIVNRYLIGRGVPKSYRHATAVVTALKTCVTRVRCHG